MLRKMIFGMLGGVAAVCYIVGVSEGTAIAKPPPAPVFQLNATLLMPEAYHYEQPWLKNTSPYFEVRCVVTNISQKPQTICAYSCSWYMNWQTDDKQIFCLGWDCCRNSPQEIKIAPGKSYEKILPLTTPSEAKGKTVRFRIGFTAVTPNGTKFKPPITWSAPLLLSVPK